MCLRWVGSLSIKGPKVSSNNRYPVTESNLPVTVRMCWSSTLMRWPLRGLPTLLPSICTKTARLNFVLTSFLWLEEDKNCNTNALPGAFMSETPWVGALTGWLLVLKFTISLLGARDRVNSASELFSSLSRSTAADSTSVTELWSARFPTNADSDIVVTILFSATTSFCFRFLEFVVVSLFFCFAFSFSSSDISINLSCFSNFFLSPVNFAFNVTYSSSVIRPSLKFCLALLLEIFICSFSLFIFSICCACSLFKVKSALVSSMFNFVLLWSFFEICIGTHVVPR